MKLTRVAFAILALALSSTGWGQAGPFTKYAPVAGIQKSTGLTYVNTAAASSDVIGLWSGCTGSNFLRGDGTCAAPAGTGVSSVAVPAPLTATSCSGGACVLSWTTGQTANQILATPNGTTGAVSLRSLVSGDVPPVNLGSTANGGVSSATILLGTNGGTSNGFFSVTGPTTSLKTFTFPNSSATVLTSLSLANPTGVVGLTAVNGSAATVMRSDAAPALDQSIAPTWTGAHTFTQTTSIPVNTTDGIIAGTYPVGSIASARIHLVEPITAHAHYAVLDDSTITMASGGSGVGHASFDGNATISGSTSFDHHHDFQAVTHIQNSGTLTEHSGFWVQPQITSGTVTAMELFRGLNPVSSGGTITTLYGLHLDAMTSGGTNWAIATEGTTPSSFGGTVSVGALNATASTIPVNGVYLPSANTLGFSTGTTQWGTLNAGNWVMNSPTTGTTLTVNGVGSSNYAFQIFAPNSAGSRGMRIQAGTSAGDFAVVVANAASTKNYFIIDGSGAISGYGAVAGSSLDMSPDFATYTGTLTGINAVVNQTIKLEKMGNIVCAFIDSDLTGTSNANTMTITGTLPAGFAPGANRVASVGNMQDNGVGNQITGQATMSSGGTITLAKLNNTALTSSTNWTTSGTKGINAGWTFCYPK